MQDYGWTINTISGVFPGWLQVQSYVSVLDAELAAAMRLPARRRDSGHIRTDGAQGGTSGQVFDGFEDVVDTVEGNVRRSHDGATQVPATVVLDGTNAASASISRQQQQQQQQQSPSIASVSDDSDAEGDVKRARLARRRLSLTARRRRAESVPGRRQ